MNLLGIGMPELIFVVLLALIILGPKDMQKAGKTIANSLRKIITSPEWRMVKDTSNKISTLPEQWMREANQDLDKLRNDVGGIMPDTNKTLGIKDINNSVPLFKRSKPEEQKTENIIATPHSSPDEESGNA